MSLTNKKVLWTSYKKQGLSIDNKYGDRVINEPVTILARKQSHQEVIKGDNGQELLTKNIYYVDARTEVNALSIEKLDLLDGDTIEQIYDMCDLFNNVIMRRFITV